MSGEAAVQGLCMLALFDLPRCLIPCFGAPPCLPGWRSFLLLQPGPDHDPGVQCGTAFSFNIFINVLHEFWFPTQYGLACTCTAPSNF